ncbi:hypothetical protein J1614_007833 [Plenodomus biglobosus]|nr:hypothetical protein J1614_007833 [Plenodomus biglobosus]
MQVDLGASVAMADESGPQQATSSAPLNPTSPTVNVPQSAPARTLPSLLRYVDHHIMQAAALHNRPPHQDAKCPVCTSDWNASIPWPNVVNTAISNSARAATVSTFLPLTPCQHWVHYRCLIVRACDTPNPSRDKCPVCNMQLYEWDGMTALTLATRTGLTLVDTNPRGRLIPASQTNTSQFQPSDTVAFVTECLVIDNLIHQVYRTHLGVPSIYADGSPDLVQAYYDVLIELDKRDVPRAKWLSWSTQTGFLLFGMLVVIKMRRFLVENQSSIMRTEAWRVFEDGGRQLQGRILGEVHAVAE